jgi:hypothetical protein
MANVRYPNMKKRNIPQVSDSVSRKMAASAQNILLALAIAILADVFDFDDEQIELFKTSYLQLSESLGVGTDTIEKIKANIKEIYGVNV